MQALLWDAWSVWKTHAKGRTTAKLLRSIVRIDSAGPARVRYNGHEADGFEWECRGRRGGRIVVYTYPRKRGEPKLLAYRG